MFKETHDPNYSPLTVKPVMELISLLQLLLGLSSLTGNCHEIDDSLFFNSCLSSLTVNIMEFIIM